MAPANDVVQGASDKGPPKAPPRVFGGAVEVRFGVPYFEVRSKAVK